MGNEVSPEYRQRLDDLAETLRVKHFVKSSLPFYAAGEVEEVEHETDTTGFYGGLSLVDPLNPERGWRSPDSAA